MTKPLPALIMVPACSSASCAAVFCAVLSTESLQKNDYVYFHQHAGHTHTHTNVLASHGMEIPLSNESNTARTNFIIGGIQLCRDSQLGTLEQNFLNSFDRFFIRL